MRVKVGQFSVSDLGAWLAGTRHDRSRDAVPNAAENVPPSQLPLVHYDSMEQPATGPLGVDTEDPRQSLRSNRSDAGRFRPAHSAREEADTATAQSSGVPPFQASRSAYGSLLPSGRPRPLSTSIRSQLSTRSTEAGSLLTSLFNATEATMAQMVRTESHSTESRVASAEGEDALAPGDLRLWVINRAALHQRRKIASGGSGQVWEGAGGPLATGTASRHEAPPRPRAGRYNRTRVAIKELFSALMDPEALEEFVQEASLQSQLRHPNIGAVSRGRTAVAQPGAIARHQRHKPRMCPHAAARAVLFYGIGASSHGDGVPALVTEYCPVTLSSLLTEVGRRKASERHDAPSTALQGAVSRASTRSDDAALLTELAASYDPYFVALDVAFGMEYLHERDVIHQVRSPLSPRCHRLATVTCAPQPPPPRRVLLPPGPQSGKRAHGCTRQCQGEAAAVVPPRATTTPSPCALPHCFRVSRYATLGFLSLSAPERGNTQVNPPRPQLRPAGRRSTWPRT